MLKMKVMKVMRRPYTTDIICGVHKLTFALAGTAGDEEDAQQPAAAPAPVKEKPPPKPRAPKRKPQLSSADAARVRQLAATTIIRNDEGRPVLPVKIKGDRNDLTLVELGRCV
jgi:hypothetical protein